MAIYGRLSAGTKLQHVLRFRAELAELSLLRISGSLGCNPVTSTVGSCRAYASSPTTGVLRAGLGPFLAKCNV